MSKLNDYCTGLVTSQAGKASGLALVLEAAGSELGYPGVGSAIGWIISGIFSRK